MELFLLYIASVVVSFLMLCDSWRRVRDLELGEAILFLYLTLIPLVNVPAAFLAWAFSAKDFIVWRKK